MTEQDTSVPEGWLHTYEMDTDHFDIQNLKVVVAKCWILGFVL